VPKEVPPIDWDHWRKAIRTPGVVEQFKSEYDTEMKKENKLNTAELEQKKRTQEAEIRALEGKAATSADFLKELKDEIAWTQHWYERPEEMTQGTFQSWNQFKRDHYYPSYKIHRMNRYMFLGQPLRHSGRDVDKLKNVDLVELRKQLDSGNVRAMAAVVPILNEFDVSGLQRPFSKKWLPTPNWEEVFKNPNTSLVYRAFALKQIGEV